MRLGGCGMVPGDFRTITPLERSEELGDQAFLSEEEVANFEQEVVDRNEELAGRAARLGGAGPVRRCGGQSRSPPP